MDSSASPPEDSTSVVSGKHEAVYTPPALCMVDRSPRAEGAVWWTKTEGAMKTHESERRRVTLVAQAMQTPGEPRCDEETLAGRLEQWEDRRRTPPGGTPAFERFALEEALARARATREEAEP